MNEIIYVGKHTLTYSVTKHLHKNWELIYCTSGSGELVFSNKSIPYCEDSIVIIPPMMPHTNKSDLGFTNIHVVIADPSIKIAEPIILSGLKNHHLRNAFSAVFYYNSTGGAESAALLPIYGQLIMTILESMVSTEAAYSEIVRQISDSILKNYPDPNFNLNETLHAFSFSTEYLKRIFKQEMGMTPRQYLTEKRLENAAKNLAMGGENISISQIARLSGYSDPLYFSKIFKSRYGVSPKNYKQETVQPTAADSDSTKIYL